MSLNEAKRNDKANKKTDKSCAWSVTTNNPTPEDLENWKNAIHNHVWIKEVHGQMEVGEQGTPHIQGMLKTDSVRISQVKKAFPRAHIEFPTKGALALQRYCSKEDTRLATLPSQQQSVKVATQKDLQDTLSEVVLEDLYHFHKGIAIGYIHHVLYMNKGKKSFNKTIVEYGYDTPIPSYRVFEANAEYIDSVADTYIDIAVNKLIRAGYFGIETVICNNQVRNGVKKYLASILIRNASQTSP